MQVDEEDLSETTHEDAVIVLKSTGQTVKLLISRGVYMDDTLQSTPSPTLDAPISMYTSNIIEQYWILTLNAILIYA